MRVNDVNTNTAGTAMRARDQVVARAALSSRKIADQYAPPRKTEVIRESTVQAKYWSVRSGKSNKGIPARNTRAAATNSNQRISGTSAAGALGVCSDVACVFRSPTPPGPVRARR